MGTTWKIGAYAPENITTTTIEAVAARVFASVIASFSNWDETSTVSRFNRAASGDSIPLSAAEQFVITSALQMTDTTGGAFDPCLGNRTAELHFTAADPFVAAPHPTNNSRSWQQLDVVDGGLRQPGGIMLDLSAIAKGYAVDCVCDELSATGIDACLVEIGGEFRATGIKPDLQPWWVGIDAADARNAWDCVMALADCAVATSGRGRRIHQDATGGATCHIVPSTWRAKDDATTAVSVIASTCMLADAWATALYASGMERGIELADANSVAAVFHVGDGEQRLSLAMTPLVDANCEEGGIGSNRFIDSDFSDYR